MSYKELLVACLLALPLAGSAKGIRVAATTQNRQAHSITVEQLPQLGWQLTSLENGTLQSAYEIACYHALSGELVWNSGKVKSSETQFITLDKEQLGNPSADELPIYNWQVRVWDEADTVSEWSDMNTFQLASAATFAGSEWIGAITRAQANAPTGRRFHGTELRKPEIKAAWEAVDTLAKKSIYLRRSFQADKKIKKAIASVCGQGAYELSINGQRIGDAEFAPLWSDYDKSVYYNTYEVTSQLQRGSNAVGVLLGNGFYNVQGGRYRKLQISFGPPTLLFALHLYYEDGTQETIHSDHSWKYDLSPILFNCIYGGEDYDARLEQKGWDTPRFNDAAWRSVVVQEAPKGKLRSQQAPPVKIMERYGKKSVTKLTPQQVEAATKSTKRTVDGSAFVLDMGQNLAGYPEITVRGKKGDKITLVVAESLTPEGACNQRQTGRQHYYEYTLKGEGKETWHPRFSYYGYRYIQVEGAVLKGDKNPSKLPVIDHIESCFIYNSAAKGSTFESSNTIFNQAHRLIEKATRSNMQAVFTDCPHREKLGWLEQVHLNGPGLYYNYDLTSYIPQQLQNMADAQHQDGAIPTTAPEYVVFEGPGMDDFAQSPEWGSALIISPFMYRDAYGDDSMIHLHYNAMRRYLDYLTARAQDGILSFGLGDWYDYGNFKAGFSRNTPVPLVATAQYYMDIQHMIEAATLVGNQADAAYYTQLLKEVNEAFHRVFYHPETKQYGTGSQCSNALPLFLGMVPAADKEAVLQNLVADIKKQGNRLTTGDVGNRYLFQTLARNGLNELMYTMHNHEDAPGYGFQLKFGATTLTEQWDPRQGSSWNHFMMGQIDEWFFYSLAGIRAVSNNPGMQEVEIAPMPVGDLTYLKASTTTLYGQVAVDWKRYDGVFTLTVTIPVGSTARVYLPDGSPMKQVGSGVHHFRCNY